MSPVREDGVGSGKGSLLASVAQNVDQRADDVCVIDEKGSWSYRELWQQAASIESSLRELGVRAGDVVSLQLPNERPFVAAYVAVTKIGAIANPLLMHYEGRQLDNVVREARPSAALVAGRWRDRDVGQAWLDMASTAEWPLVVGVLGTELTFDLTVPKGRRSEHARSFAPTDEVGASPTLLIFTSGTVRAKGVVHTHDTLDYGLRALADALQLGQDRPIWMPSPVSHGTGLQWGVRMSLFVGSPLVLQDRWDAGTALRILETHPSYFTMSATTFLHDLVTEAERSRRAIQLEYFVCAGAPIPPSTVERAQAVGLTVLPAFGMTEHFVSLLVHPTDPSAFRTTSDGRAMPGTTLAIRTAADEVTTAVGAAGELMVRGPGVAPGYLDGVAPMLVDGWQRTGDLATVVDDGFFRILGRQKDLIIRGGLNIAPRAIEEALMQHVSIAEASVFGLPDERLGERICAGLVLADNSVQPSDADLTSFLRHAGLAKFMWPEVIHWVGELPKTASGKVRKHALRDRVVTDRADSGSTGPGR